MQVVVASDHAGFELKSHLIKFLKSQGHTVKNLGTNSLKPVDYPDYAEKLGLEIVKDKKLRGILICGSGVGASVAANKINGVRAAICHDSYSAHQGVEHDNMNVLVLGSRVIGPMLAEDLVKNFLSATFRKNVTRYMRRLKKVMALEEKR